MLFRSPWQQHAAIPPGFSTWPCCCCSCSQAAWGWGFTCPWSEPSLCLGEGEYGDRVRGLEMGTWSLASSALNSVLVLLRTTSEGNCPAAQRDASTAETSTDGQTGCCLCVTLCTKGTVSLPLRIHKVLLGVQQNAQDLCLRITP